MDKEQETILLKLYQQFKSVRIVAHRTGINHKEIVSFLKFKEIEIVDNVSPKLDFVNCETVKCSKCKQDKYINEYMIMRKGKKYEYRLTYCNECRKKQSLKNVNSDPVKILRDIYLRLSQRANKYNIKFDLDWEYLLNLYKIQNGECFYSNIKFVIVRGIKYNPLCCTVDKVIPELGYVKGNVVLCSKRYNTVKSDLTLEEIRLHMPTWYDKLIKTEWLDLGDKNVKYY